MRIVPGLLLLALSLSGLGVAADQPLQPAPLPPAEEHTTVRGTPSADLAGRWMLVGWIDAPGGKTRSTAALWEIRQEDGSLVLVNHFAGLPAAQGAALLEANRVEEPWRPTAADVAAVAAAWDSLPKVDPRFVKIENEIVARDGFDDSFKQEDRTKSAVWVVRQTDIYDPSAAPAIKQINVYAALEPKDGGWVGNYTTVTLAAVPLPIPITLNGTFQSYRVGDAPASPRGLFARVLDLFSGCGRR